MVIDRWGGFYEILSWALIMASATPYTYLPDKIPNHRKNEVFDDPACPPEWPKVADTVIEAFACIASATECIANR